PLEHPQKETYWGNVNPVGLRGVYDEAKRFAEALTMAYHRYHGVQTRIVRIFNTYGPRMRLNDGRALPAFMRQALCDEPVTVHGTGDQTRSFAYVDDTIEGIVRLLNSNVRCPVNIGSRDEISIMDFAKEIISLTNSQSTIIQHKLPEDDPKNRQPDTSLAQDLLGWRPRVDRIEGLQRTLAYVRQKIRQTP
ncbi:MAG: NAD-dependent epimerase/dehydratase family protein, partial [Rhodothermaceae bacterium]|nr:NAD-dependent epimerase/dehydratase family protein [Rhodothermaceae bacterium]